MKIIFFKNKDQIQTNLLDFPKIQTNIFFASPILDKDIQHLCAGQIIQPPPPPPGSLGVRENMRVIKRAGHSKNG